MGLCIHEFPIDQCSDCKGPPSGIKRTVYVTKGGYAFHNDPNCETLKAGQEEAEAKGLNTHPISPVGWGSVIRARRPCKNCCPNFETKP